MRIVLDALLQTGMQVVATKANADAGGKAINDELEEYARRSSLLHVFESLGSLRFLSAMKYAKFVIGNSSSGILEAPVFGVPTVNVGPRQDGRLRSISVIDCELNSEAILSAISKALDPAFLREISNQPPIFGTGNVSRPAARIIKHYLDAGFPKVKVFRDL